MKKFSESLKTKLTTWMISLVILFALCFSIGEGLRLTPFPVSTLTINEASHPQLAVKPLQAVSLYKYGPLDVPPQIQKRNKRHIVEFACAPSEIVRRPAARLNSSCDRQASQVVSVQFISRLAGRDPPSPA